MQYIEPKNRKPKLPPKPQHKPRWASKNDWQKTLKNAVHDRSRFFEGYAFNGVTIDGVYYSPDDCADFIVIYSEMILKIIEEIGRKPLGQTAEELGLKPQPHADTDWQRRQRQKFALYLSRAELTEATRGITGSRYFELAKIDV